MSHDQNTALPHKHMKHPCHTTSSTSRVTNTWTFMQKCAHALCMHAEARQEATIWHTVTLQ